MNIKNKITISISTVSAISLLAIGSILYVLISNIITSRVDEVLSVTLNNNTNTMKEWINGKSTALKMMKDSVISTYPNGLTEPTILLSYKNDPEISALFVSYDDKSTITEQKLPPDFDPTTRPWYIGAKEANGLFITDPFISKGNGENTVSISYPIEFTNGKKGVISENIGLTAVLNRFKEVKYIGDGYLVIIDKQGVFVLHPNKDLLGKNIKDVKGLEDLTQKVMSNESGLEKYVFNNDNKIMMWKTIPGTTWKMQAVIDSDLAYKQKDTTLYLTITIFFFSLLVSIIIGIIIARNIGKPLAQITASCDVIASGDFSNEIDEKLLLRKDEIGTLAKGFKKIEESVNIIFKDISASINSIAVSSEELTKKIRVISDDSKVQADNTFSVSETTINFKESMNQVLDNIRNQVAGIEETASSITEISNTVNEVAIKTNNTRNISNEAAESSTQGNIKVEESLRSMSEMEDVTKNIEEAVKGINSISEQTNLLALNAAIEAARAGDAGKGFAVVADEVKKLAENSKKFTESIVQLIHELRNKTDENYNLSSFVGDNLKEISKKVLNTNQELQYVAESMKLQDSAIKEISEAMNNVSTGSSNVESLVMDEIERLNKTVLSIDSISAIAQNTADSTENLLKSSLDLVNETTKIKNTMSQFKLK